MKMIILKIIIIIYIIRIKRYEFVFFIIRVDKICLNCVRQKLIKGTCTCCK